MSTEIICYVKLSCHQRHIVISTHYVLKTSHDTCLDGYLLMQSSRLGPYIACSYKNRYTRSDASTKLVCRPVW